MEKRVRSRCQSQVLQICPENDLTAFVALARYFLRLDPILWKRKGKFESKFAIEWNQEIDVSSA